MSEFMTEEDFGKFLEDIGGLENGFYTDRPKIKEVRFFSIGYGWYGIVKDLITDLISLGWNKEVCQVKEKFGGLRFYINEGSDEIYDRIRIAEELSYKTCEVCGIEGKIRGNLRWWRTLCDTYYEEALIKQKTI
jgi:hypothetical protein